jgi:hypothetical protein
MILTLLAAWGGAAFGADVTVGPDSDFREVLEDPAREDGDVVTIAVDVNPELGGGGYINVTKRVTLRGQADEFLISEVVADAVSALNEVVKSGDWRSVLDGHWNLFGDLVGKVEADLPTTRLLGGQNPGDGICFEAASSLENLTIKGFYIYSNSTDTYRPHITSSPPASGLAADSGFDAWVNVAVANNSISHKGQFDGGVLGGNNNNANDVYAAKMVVGLASLNNDVYSAGGMVTGGAIGAWADFDLIDESIFARNEIVSDQVAGGSAMAPIHIGTISDSLVYQNKSFSSGSIAAGGAVYMHQTDWRNDQGFAIGLMENTYFIANTAEGIDAMGGAISVRGTDGLGELRNSVFAFNDAVGSVGAALGGAIDAGANPSNSGAGGGGGINLLDGCVFYANGAISFLPAATGDAYGGAIIVGGRDDSATGPANLENFTILDTLFIGNLAYSSNGRASGGALYVGTNMAISGAPGWQVINFTTSPGGLTEFSGNTANGAADGIGVGSANEDDSTVNIRFKVDPGEGGLVLFADPVTVLMNNGMKFELERTGGPGEFRWGGANVVDADGGSFITFGAGRTVLLADFNLAGGPANPLEVTLGGGADVVLELAGRDPGAPFLTNPILTTNSGVVISVTDPTGYKIGDFSGEFVFASGAGLPPASGFTLNPVIEGYEGTGLAASATMIIDSGALVVKVASTGTAAAFTRAGVNAGLAREAITAVFNSQSAEQRRATLASVMGDLGTFTGEPLAGTAAALLDSTWTVINEARGRFIRAMGPGSPGQGSLASGAPSAGDGDHSARVWGGFLFRRLDQDASGGFHGFGSDTYGGVVGVSGSFTEGLDLGFYISAGRNSTDYEGLAASLEGDFLQFGLVSALRAIPRLTIAADVSYSNFDVHSERELGAFGTAKARYDSKVLSVGLEASYAVALSGRTTLSPFLELRYQSLGQDGFTEDGGGIFGLEFGQISHDDFFTRLGAEIAFDIGTSGGAVLAPKAKLAWRHRFGSGLVASEGRYAGNPGVFPVRARLADRDQAEAGVGFQFQPSGREGLVSLDLGYDFALGQSSREHNAFLTVDFRW